MFKAAGSVKIPVPPLGGTPVRMLWLAVCGENQRTKHCRAGSVRKLLLTDTEGQALKLGCVQLQKQPARGGQVTGSRHPGSGLVLSEGINVSLGAFNRSRGSAIRPRMREKKADVAKRRTHPRGNCANPLPKWLLIPA